MGGVLKANTKPMPRIVPGTAPPRLETKSTVSFPLNFLRTTRKAMTMPVRPAMGVAYVLRNVVSRIDSTPRVSICFHHNSVGVKSLPQAALNDPQMMAA